MNLYAVYSDQINQVWDKVLPLVVRSLEYADGKWTPDDIKTALSNRDMQLYVLGEDISAMVITQIQKYTTKKVMCFMFCAGVGMRDWVNHLVNSIESWARAEGCDAIELIGRPGWERVLGWERIHVVLRKELK